MRKTTTIDDVQQLKEQLYRVRQQSLMAARQDDFRSVARLTSEAARLNRAIHVQEDFAGSASKSLAIVDALAKMGVESSFVFPQEPAPALAECASEQFEKAA